MEQYGIKRFLISIYSIVKLIVQPKFYFPQVFSMENYFNYHKILKSGYLYCEEKDSQHTFNLTENLGHFSTEGVTAPLSKMSLLGFRNKKHAVKINCSHVLLHCFNIC